MRRDAGRINCRTHGRLPVNGVRPSVKAPIFEATGAETRPVRWLDFDAQGSATVGEGVPDWWSGPPSC
jgi:hypothetical protein